MDLSDVLAVLVMNFPFVSGSPKRSVCCDSLLIMGLTKSMSVHSKLCDITLVATKMHVTLRNYVLLTWMCDEIVFCVACDIVE